MKNFSIKLFVATLFLLVCFTRNGSAQDGGTFYLGYGVATANSIDDVIADIIITTATGGSYRWPILNIQAQFSEDIELT